MLRVALLSSVLLASVASANAAVDCAHCNAVCSEGDTAVGQYPDDLKPERVKGVQHNDPSAEAAFVQAQRSDPAFGGRDIPGAIANYKRAATLDSKNPQYRNYLAASLMRAGKFREAIYNLKHTVELVPTSAKYRVNLGYAYHKVNNEPRALVNYMRALMLDAGDVRARLFAGFAMEKLGMYDDAELEFRRVLLQAPNHTRAKRALARVMKKAARGQ